MPASAHAASAREHVDRCYRVFASVRSVRFNEMEYAVPREAVSYVLPKIDNCLRRSGERVAFPIEVRFASSDDIWLPTTHKRDTGYIAVHRYYRCDHRLYFDAGEAIARSVGGRPPWGKMHKRTAAELRPAYRHFDAFVALRDQCDPNRIFDKDYLHRVLGS